MMKSEVLFRAVWWYLLASFESEDVQQPSFGLWRKHLMFLFTEVGSRGGLASDLPRLNKSLL